MKKLVLLVIIMSLIQVINGFAQSQNREIVFGTVTDVNGAPLPGANIIVKHYSQGTVSDITGYFELEMDAKDTLCISYIGFKSDTLTFQDVMENNSIKLEETGYVMDEVWVVAYGTRRVSTLSCIYTIRKLNESIELQIGFPKRAWRYYPNPTIGQLNIETKNATGVIRLFSSAGKLLKELPITADLSNLDLHNFPAGTYFLWYTNKTGWEEPIGKVVKLD